jgi:hypothetical protein
MFDLGHTKVGLSQKPARIGMITARQRVGLRPGHFVQKCSQKNVFKKIK